MGKSAQSGVTNGDPEEWQLVRLVVDFANAPPPSKAAEAVEAEERFKGHPFVEAKRFHGLAGTLDRAGSRFIGSDPHSVAAAVENKLEYLTEYWTDIRWALAGLAREAPSVRSAARQRLVARLRQALGCEEDGELIEGRVNISFRPGRGLRLGFIPLLQTAEQAYFYGLALLMDSGRDLARGFTQCHAPMKKPGEGECGRFFWRDMRRQRYCSPACTRLAARAANVCRQQRFRRRRG